MKEKETKNEIKAIIFDIGGVLLFPRDQKNQSTHLFNSSKAGFRLSRIINMKDKKLLGRIMRIYLKSSGGEISADETFELFSKELNMEKKEIQKIFYNIYRENLIENSLLMKLAKKLKKEGYRIGIVSDQSYLSTKAVMESGRFSFFNAKVISCIDKARKPSEKPYLLILKKLNIKAKEALFIDDRMRNIKPAKRLGMKTILFKNNNQFFNEVKRFNL